MPKRRTLRWMEALEYWVGRECNSQVTWSRGHWTFQNVLDLDRPRQIGSQLIHHAESYYVPGRLVRGWHYLPQLIYPSTINVSDPRSNSSWTYGWANNTQYKSIINNWHATQYNMNAKQWRKNKEGPFSNLSHKCVISLVLP